MTTQQFAREGVWIVGSVVIASIVMLGILAVVHDGQLAATITAELVAAIQWGLPVLGVLVGVGQLVSGYVAGKASATATATATPLAQPSLPTGPTPTPPPTVVPGGIVTPAQVIAGG